MDYIYILGIKLHKIKKKDILEKIKGWITGDSFHYITTVNPEFILEAQKDQEFKEILNNADLSIPDGIGLKFAAWFFGRNIYRVAGSDLTKDILKLAEQKNCSLYFFVWKDGLSSAEYVKNSILKLAGGCLAGKESSAHGKIPPNPPLGKGGINMDGQAIKRDGSDIDWEKFNNFKPDIILVGLGAPYQEKFIERIKNREKQSSSVLRKIPPNPPLGKGGIKVAIGVGGTFDFLTGKIKRAPKIMQIIGLEWLWRLIQQPKKHRIKRIFNAVIVFPYEVLKWRIKILFQ